MTVASPQSNGLCVVTPTAARWRLHRASGVLSMPVRQRQAISRFLFLALHFFVRGIGGKFREPDLLLVTDAKGPHCRNDYWVGADLSWRW